MTKLKQKDVFDGLEGFEEKKFGGGCYKGPDGQYYRVSHFSKSYVIESAESESEAKNGIFEDDDLFDDTLEKDVLLDNIRMALTEYTQ